MGRVSLANWVMEALGAIGDPGNLAILVAGGIYQLVTPCGPGATALKHYKQLELILLRSS